MKKRTFCVLLYSEVCTTFGSKVVQISAVIEKYTKFAGLYFPHFTIFRDQTCNKMLFLAVGMDFVLPF